jgi:hypothetical protein
MSLLWAYTGYDPFSVASCRGQRNDIPRQPPEDGSHLSTHVGVKFGTVKIYCLTHLLVILQRYYKMLGPTIKVYSVVGR